MIDDKSLRSLTRKKAKEKRTVATSPGYNSYGMASAIAVHKGTTRMTSGVLDIVLVYLFKGAMRMFYYFQSSRWERMIAFVTGQVVLDPLWGCPSVKLHYRFDSNGHSTKGSDVIPVLWRLEARSYAGSFRHNHPVTIRVNPTNPQKTHFFKRDQKGGVPTT